MVSRTEIQAMNEYRYLRRHWCELLATGSLALIAMIIAAPLWH
jgi:hypothetical protein